MNKKLFIILAFLFIACSENISDVIENDSPRIEYLKISEYWSLASINLNLIELKVSDIQGISDIKSVVFRVENSFRDIVFSDSLFDDGGINGSTDILFGDGVFRNVFQASVITPQESVLFFRFTVTDQSFNTDSISQQVAFIFNEAPVISNIVAPDSFLSGVSTFNVSVTIGDLDNDFQNDKVFMDILLDDNSILIEPYQLYNDGNQEISGDMVADDSIYSFRLDSTFSVGKSGDYKLQFFAEDQLEELTPKITQDLYLQNFGPAVIAINMPAFVEKPAPGGDPKLIPIKVLVNDPQGYADINRVYFELRASNGTYRESSPGVHEQLDLFDSGDDPDGLNIFHGDLQIGDRVYSEILQVTQGNVSDTYTFEFYVIDKVGNTSQVTQFEFEIRNNFEN